MKTCQGAIALV
jgi:Ca2+/Na+ antiporter